MPGWEDELERWLTPFLDRLGHKTRQRKWPPYAAGLIGLGDLKSVQPMAERLATSNHDQLHHSIADGVWDATPLETELLTRQPTATDRSDCNRWCEPIVLRQVTPWRAGTQHH